MGMDGIFAGASMVLWAAVLCLLSAGARETLFFNIRCLLMLNKNDGFLKILFYCFKL